MASPSEVALGKYMPKSLLFGISREMVCKKNLVLLEVYL